MGGGIAGRIGKYASVAELDDIKAEEYRYWQSRPVQERIDAVSEFTQALYAMKGAVEREFAFAILKD